MVGTNTCSSLAVNIAYVNIIFEGPDPSFSSKKQRFFSFGDSQLTHPTVFVGEDGGLSGSCLPFQGTMDIQSLIRIGAPIARVPSREPDVRTVG